MKRYVYFPHCILKEQTAIIHLLQIAFSFHAVLQESKIAEILFLPPKEKLKKCHDMNEDSRGRSRISARQQQKRERARRKMREKEAAEALAGKSSLLRGLCSLLHGSLLCCSKCEFTSDNSTVFP